jgi:hypothetical protein
MKHILNINLSFCNSLPFFYSKSLKWNRIGFFHLFLAGKYAFMKYCDHTPTGGMSIHFICPIKSGDPFE